MYPMTNMEDGDLKENGRSKYGLSSGEDDHVDSFFYFLHLFRWLNCPSVSFCPWDMGWVVVWISSRMLQFHRPLYLLVGISRTCPDLFAVAPGMAIERRRGGWIHTTYRYESHDDSENSTSPGWGVSTQC